ncbi:phage tail protein [Halomonas urumqiensis]|uniref:Phage tail protein n=1 Tax=Halomonas urumqiensis TaxID=1684789 RepID=A0A2N7UDN2_9GAMM|nr:phage tail protein [Halomonas urumqiensis]PMR78527.1 hypothetical protein C1H70_17445 [Halomonas urumqiensis]PTB03672.1 hypothetical protein C6V82_04075 [Halomonas urumqiensis]GHE20115.1 hypothetical protein GCM10017767_06360 [Halomonas urumqiensis]
MAEFYTLITDTGQAKLAAALANNESIELGSVAVGDGGGSLPTPEASRTALIDEVHRAPINHIAVDADNPNWLIVETVLPPEIGGWTIREVGVYDTEGELIVYGNYPESYKPLLAEGSGRTQTVRIIMQVSDTAAVTLTVDPSIVLATRQLLEERIAAHAASRDHPGATEAAQGMIQRATKAQAEAGSDNTRAMTPLRVRQAIDLFRLGAPATLSGGSTNQSTSESHTHQLAMATKGQAEAGSDATRLMSALRVHQAFNQFGIGGVTQGVPGNDLSTVDGTVPSGLYKVYTNTSGTPVHLGTEMSTNGHVVWLRRGASGGEAQLLFAELTGQLYYRTRTTGAWPDWRMPADPANSVPPQRAIVAGDGLSGGGDFTTNRSLKVDSSVARTNTQIIAGNGLTGGGTLGANRTLNLGTPRTIYAGSNNGFSGSGHSHELRVATPAEVRAGTNTTGVITPRLLTEVFMGSRRSLATNGYQMLPGVFVSGAATIPRPLILQWGRTSAADPSRVDEWTSFPIPFPNRVLVITANHSGTYRANISHRGETDNGCYFLANGYSGPSLISVQWFAIGY